MTIDYWVELNTLQEVATAQSDGWEIEYCVPNGWLKWDGKYWCDVPLYRGRPAKPKMKTVTSECWRNKSNGDMLWRQPEYAEYSGLGWQRFPAGDITGEVGE